MKIEIIDNVDAPIKWGADRTLAGHGIKPEDLPFDKLEVGQAFVVTTDGNVLDAES